LKERIETDKTRRDERDSEVFFIFLTGIGREDEPEYEETEIEIPSMPFFHISKPEIRIHFAIDHVGEKGPYHKDAQYHKVFFGSSHASEEKERGEHHESDKEEYLYFFKTSEIENTKKLRYICKCGRYTRDIPPCIC
jgi:hypothetical protein